MDDTRRKELLAQCADACSYCRSGDVPVRFGLHGWRHAVTREVGVRYQACDATHVRNQMEGE